ncbi:MAG: AbrB/MazE/SpoVT family DNA-binding domain-containing protein [Candidatus Freyarchaeota archaeon]|nr:AbrB/MazE/SpoVT family DNA-binding domain-containing protein [Candidatus Jordarchaeia archaeon]MBS7268098.1 AbrB/MazE/SpoVT family DNA-binding domain-containing protein [Candidatus Jordarchaeia archaeon]MBS7278999.1 AbrB/MazE/SpoVT family DNA-binding domain-containing protein [Candidatus Jordarchaeia archaeon]
MAETFAKVDKKGRVLIPSKIREELNIKNIVEIEVQGRKIILKPVEDPLDSLEKVVVKGTKDVEKEISTLRRIAERELSKGGS